MGDTHFYFVRVWQHKRQFRAAVQSDDDGEPRLFTEPEQVGEFLRQVHTAAGGTHTPATAEPSSPNPGARRHRATSDGGHS